MDLEEQYDKIYRYCYFKVHQREMAEDITQETFLRFLESRMYTDTGQALHYLYTIARNLCIDEYRKRPTVPFKEDTVDSSVEDNIVTGMAVKMALSQLDETDQELLLLRHVNEVSVSDISKMFGVSRFVIYRRMAQAEKNLKNKLGKEDFT